MKKETYSTYDAKARFSELLRKVRRNRRIVITHRGKPVAELGPVTKAELSLSERLEALRELGILEPGHTDPPDRVFEPVGKSPGALKRFLDERD
jgi:prevent-host-death family protein